MAATASGVHLLERETELGALGAAVADAAAGRGSALVVEGPGGIGKTALLEAATLLAGDAGMWVAAAAGRPLERDYPFGVVRQLFERPLRDAPAREELLRGAAAPAGALLGAVPPGAVAPDAAFAFVHALYWLAANLAERQPLLLAVDDVQWADAESLAGLAYLAARVEEHPIALVAANRSDEPGVRDPLGPGAAIVTPSPLTRAGVAGLVRATIGAQASDELCVACHEATGGNPFLARELAAAAAGGELPAWGAPEAVSRATLPRIERLGPGAVALARAVAVLDRAQLAHAGELAGLGEREAAAAAAALAGAAILDDGLPLRFRHPILRDVVLADLDAAARDGAHRRAAAILADAGADPETIGSHLLLCEPRGDERAVETLRDAGRRALAQGAPDAAVRALRRALAELDAGAGADRVAVLHEVGRAEAAAGEPAAADRLAEAHRLADAADTRAAILGTLAETRFVAGDLAAAIDAYRAALDELDGGAPAQQAFLGYTMLGRAYVPAARDAHERIRGRRGSDEPAELAALAYDGFLTGAPAGAVIASAKRALDGARLLDAGGPAAQAFHLTTWALAGADAFDDAEAALAIAFERAAAGGSFLAYALACHHRLWSRWRRGSVVPALADAEVALELAERGWHLIGPAAAWARAECLLEIGDHDGAAQAVEQAERTSGVRADGRDGLAGSCVRAWALMARSRLELERGDPALALDAALGCGELLTRLETPNPAVADWRGRAALAAAALGDEARARELAREELRLARAFGSPRAVGMALRTAAAVEQGEAAIDLLLEAERVLDGSPALLERARALTALGAALRRARRPSDARERLRAAVELAERCGAAAVAERARDELLAAGARPRRAATRGPAALTPRELRVAELAAAGLGNREIAQTLFITRKTVEAHMRNIFRKLGVDARERLAEELGYRRDR